MNVRTLVPWVWTGMVAAVSLTLLVLLSQDEGPATQAVAAVFMSTVVLITALGSLIMTKRPGNRISWIFLVTGAGMLLTAVLSPSIPSEAPTDPTFWNLVALVHGNALTLATLFYPLLLLLYVFPTGRFLTRSWTWAGWFGAVMVPALVLAATFSEEIGPPFAQEPDRWLILNSIGVIPWSVLDALSTVWSIGLVVVAFGGVAAVIVRYRRSAHLVRTQIKWLLYAGVFFVISFVLISFGIGDENEAFFAFIFVAPIALIPVSVTVAITRYRLYDIDRLISRTVGYTLVIAALAGVYGLAVAGIPSVLPALEDSDLLIAAATLAAFFLFNPLRKRLLLAVDRRFYRSRYDAQGIVDEFATRLRSELDLDELTADWLDTVDQAVKPASAAVWIRSNNN